MKRLAMLFFCTTSFSGCATAPDVPMSQRYDRATWARVSLEQAAAECENDVQALKSMNMYLCMKSKGYQER